MRQFSAFSRPYSRLRTTPRSVVKALARLPPVQETGPSQSELRRDDDDVTESVATMAPLVPKIGTLKALTAIPPPKSRYRFPLTSHT